MARYVNQVTLLGNLGGDPEVRNFQTGGAGADLQPRHE